MTQDKLANEQLKIHSFLEGMYKDPYFPDFLVDKAKVILIELCHQLEKEKPKSLPELYKLTHAATDKFNDLQEDFYDNDSEIETGAREVIAADFDIISIAYSYKANLEELIATRDW